MTFRGRVRDGVIVLEPSASLPEGAGVEVRLLDVDKTHTDDAERPSLTERLRDVAGQASGLPADAALNHDHYLYGLPKR